MLRVEPSDDNAPIALVDLGDTLCDCTSALRDSLARLRKPGERAHDETLVPLPPHLELRRRRVMGAPGFWLELRPCALGFELLDLLREEGFLVSVLTKGPYEAPQVWADKVSWCRAHLPGVPVIVTDDKALVRGHVLVDDWPPYIARWQQRWRAGVAIVPAHTWNAQMATGPHCVRYDGHNREAVARALRSCRKRSTADS